MYKAFYFIPLFLFFTAKCAEYGSYRLRVTNMTQCKVGRMSNAPLVSNLTWVKNENGTDSLYVTADARRSLGPFGMKLRISKLDPSKKQYISILKTKIKNICDSNMAKEILARFPTVNPNCTVSKGVMTTVIQDFDKFMHVLVGNTFFYGVYQYNFDLTDTKGSSYMCTRSIFSYATE